VDLEPVLASLRRASFLTGVTRLDRLPADTGAEVAFAGRSNAGKSSAINALTGRRALARTSKTPGRTREVNFFGLDEGTRLVDLPGYGFARAPREAKARWAQLVEGYLANRRCLRGLVLLVDVRRPFTALDEQLLEWTSRAGIDVHVALTKADKLSRGAGAAELARARRRRAPHAAGFDVQLLSARDGRGVDELAVRVARWLAS
jgi:GTP-binding protein